MPSAGEGTRVLIVDDEADIRVLVQAVIEVADEGLRVVGEASNGEEAIERWRETRPDVILLDVWMPGMSGLDTAERILAELPEQRIVLFSAFLDEPTVLKASRMGIRAWVGKDEASAIPEALRGHAHT